MIRILILSASIAGVVLFCSCRPPASPANSAVVVDLDVVAKAMRRDVQIAREIETATQQLNARLLQAAQKMETELKKQQAEFGNSPTESQRTQLRQTNQRIQDNIRSNKERAEQMRQRVRDEQIQIFRDEVKPLIARLAARHQANLVLLPNQNIFWLAPSADITAEVIAEMRSKATAQPASEPAKAAATPQTNAALASPRQNQATAAQAPAKRP